MTEGFSQDLLSRWKLVHWRRTNSVTPARAVGLLLSLPWTEFNFRPSAQEEGGGSGYETKRGIWGVHTAVAHAVWFNWVNAEIRRSVWSRVQNLNVPQVASVSAPVVPGQGFFFPFQPCRAKHLQPCPRHPARLRCCRSLTAAWWSWPCAPP